MPLELQLLLNEDGYGILDRAIRLAEGLLRCLFRVSVIDQFLYGKFFEFGGSRLPFGLRIGFHAKFNLLF